MNLKNIHGNLSSRLQGYEGNEDYWKDASCGQRIHKIVTPTLFINAIDDPIIGTKCIDYEVFKQNPNVAISTTKHGGHLGYSENFCSFGNWVLKPSLKFFDALS